jgi:para-aminobenzoate synthetase component I
MPQSGALPTTASERLLSFFEQMSSHHGADYALLLGGGNEPTPLNRWNIIGLGARQVIRLSGNRLECNDKLYELSSADPQEACALLFEQLEKARQRAKSWHEAAEDLPTDLPMYGGLAGALGYGFYRWCDEGWLKPAETELSKLAEKSSFPDLLFVECEDWLFIPADLSRLTVLSEHSERRAFYESCWQQAMQTPSNPKQTPIRVLSAEEQTLYLEQFAGSLSPASFEEAVLAIKAAIQRGELYQANLSLRLQKEVNLNPLALFAQLCKQNPSPFSAFFRWPGGLIVSNSPERLVQVDAARHASTRPIAGTRGRGQTSEEEAAIARTLLENEKELAEHRMLVDLARNDLGRVCQMGTVQVDELLALERYSHVTHLVSNVAGVLNEQATPWEVLRSLFPGGTITGCPKVRCVNTLSRIEPVPRGFYTGSLGYVDARSPAMDWNILIRSVFLQERDLQQSPVLPKSSVSSLCRAFPYNAHIHVGAGIVHDAVGKHEYRECLRKASASLNALAAVEMPVLLPEKSLERIS